MPIPHTHTSNYLLHLLESHIVSFGFNHLLKEKKKISSEATTLIERKLANGLFIIKNIESCQLSLIHMDCSQTQYARTSTHTHI